MNKEQINQAFNLGKTYAPDKNCINEVKEHDKHNLDTYTILHNALNGLQQSAEYANHILPELRQLAGYEDSGDVGTFTTCPDDKAYYDYQELLEAFENGYYFRGDDNQLNF